jgi:hypothetical protein
MVLGVSGCGAGAVVPARDTPLDVACFGLLAILGFNVTHAIKRTRIQIPVTASMVNEPSVNPRAVDAGTMLVQLSVTL